jgi:hypothetical protein
MPRGLRRFQQSGHSHFVTFSCYRRQRCQHVRYNGQRCKAPALNGGQLCHFHERIQPAALRQENFERNLPWAEDATSLQFALMRMIRLMQTGHADYKFCALTLYALQIASGNIKNLRAELAEKEETAAKSAETAGAPAAMFNGNGDAVAREGLSPRADEKKDVARVALDAEESLLKR